MSKLFKKYEVKRVDGQEDPPGTVYFVLNVGTDHAAREALRTYANEIFLRDEELAAMIERMVEHYDTHDSNIGLKGEDDASH